MLLLPIIVLPGACGPKARNSFLNPEMARTAFAQEVLSRIQANTPVCLSADPRIGSMNGPNPAAAKGWTVADPSPALMALISQRGLFPHSQCPASGDKYLASLGPLLIHRSGRIEGQIAYGRPRSDTTWYPGTKLETCVAEIVDGHVNVSCGLVPHSWGPGVGF